MAQSFINLYLYTLHILQVSQHFPAHPSSLYSLETRPALPEQRQQRLLEFFIHRRYFRPVQLYHRRSAGPRLYSTPRRVDIASVRNIQHTGVYDTDKGSSFLIDIVVMGGRARESLIWVLLALFTEAQKPKMLAATLKGWCQKSPHTARSNLHRKAILRSVFHDVRDIVIGPTAAIREDTPEAEGFVSARKASLQDIVESYRVQGCFIKTLKDH